MDDHIRYAHLFMMFPIFLHYVQGMRRQITQKKLDKRRRVTVKKVPLSKKKKN